MPLGALRLWAQQSIRSSISQMGRPVRLEDQQQRPPALRFYIGQAHARYCCYARPSCLPLLLDAVVLLAMRLRSCLAAVLPARRSRHHAGAVDDA